jgi:hypothetical protein
VQRAFAGPNSTYVVIMKKSDGTYDAVIENSSFVVTTTRSVPGAMPAGPMSDHHHPDGPPAGVPGSVNQ